MKTHLLIHDVRAAWRSLRRTPFLSLLMIGAEAIGIAAAMIAITLYHGRAGHPIPWKDQTLFTVLLDNRDDSPNVGARHPEYPPSQVTYRDASALYASDIPLHSVMMFRSSLVVIPERTDTKPLD